MALVKGTNCGFVTTAPTTDPAETAAFWGGRAYAIDDTSPITNNIVKEIGIWSDLTGDSSDISLGVYTDDGTEANVLLGSTTIAKGTTAGWKKATGLSISISPETKYWIAAQSDGGLGTTKIDINTSSTGNNLIYVDAASDLPSPWGNSAASWDNYIVAIYAITDYQESTGTNTKINIGDDFKDVDSMQINIGDTWKDVTAVQQNIGDTWKDVF